MTEDVFEEIELITGLENPSKFPPSLSTREVFARLIAVLAEATSKHEEWEHRAGPLDPASAAYGQGAEDGIGCLYVAIAALQDLADGRRARSGLIGFTFAT